MKFLNPFTYMSRVLKILFWVLLLNIYLPFWLMPDLIADKSFDNFFQERITDLSDYILLFFIIFIFYIIGSLCLSKIVHHIKNFNEPKYDPKDDRLFDIIAGPILNPLFRFVVNFGYRIFPPNIKPKQAEKSGVYGKNIFGSKVTSEQSKKSLEVIKWIFIIIFVILFLGSAYKKFL